MNKKQIAIIIALAALLRLAGLGAARLWYDESFSWLVCSRPLAPAWQAIAGDVHPPLWYLLAWPWCHTVGLSEAWLRLPSLLLSLAAVWLLWRLAVRIGAPPGAQIVALLLMAVLPVQIHFAQEFRMYSLFVVEILAAVLALLDRRWKIAGLAILAALYTHNYALIYWPLLAAVALIQAGLDWRRLWPGPAAALGLPLLAWLPWALILAGQMSTVAGGYWIQPVNLGAQLEVVGKLFWGFYIPDTFLFASYLLAYGLLLYAVRHALIARPPGWALLLLLSLGPLMLASAASAAWKPILLFRGLLPSLPFVYLLIGQSIGSGPVWRRAFCLGIMAPLLIVGLLAYYPNNAREKGTIASMAAVRGAWQPGDTIIHANDGSLPAWLTYGSDLGPQYKAAGCDGEEPLGALSPLTRQGLGYQEISPDNIQGRVWLVVMDGPTSTKCDIWRAQNLVYGAQPFMIQLDSDFAHYRIYVKHAAPIAR